MPRRFRIAAGHAGWPIVLSILAHLGLVSVASVLAYEVAHSRAATRRTAWPPQALVVDLPTFSDTALWAESDIPTEGAKPDAYGGATLARVDTGKSGLGGQNAGNPATNLAAIDEDARLSPDLTSRLDRDQHQRLKTSRVRATHDDRRATTHPMELTFLATGSGVHPERRPNAQNDPSRGSLSSKLPASVVGGAPGGPEAEALERAGQASGSPLTGLRVASPGVGLRDGNKGEWHVAAARISEGRPAIAEGPPTVTATLRARASDTVDSDQEVATLVQSAVHASFAGGLIGEGRGGSLGPAFDRGAGGNDGRGSTSRTMGSGDGDAFDWFTSDPLLLPYFRKIHAKVDPLWKDAFPKSAMLELKQGTVILEFTIALDGAVRVTLPPVRPSGIEEFDMNCIEAIRRAGPFEPIPEALRSGGRTTLRIRAPFVAKNPIIK